MVSSIKFLQPADLQYKFLFFFLISFSVSNSGDLDHNIDLSWSYIVINKIPSKAIMGLCYSLSHVTYNILYTWILPVYPVKCFYITTCRYATASARSDGMFLLCGGRDTSGTVCFTTTMKSAPLSYTIGSFLSHEHFHLTKFCL